MEVIADPEEVGCIYTADIEVGGKSGTHSYQIVTKDGKRLISHNTVSLLAGVTPATHWAIYGYYIRRIRCPNDFPLLKVLKQAGFNVEPCIGSEKTTSVIEFPMKYDNKVRTQDQVSIWEKVSLASFVQENWADNQVSVTVDFNPETEGNQIEQILNYCQYKLKSVSFLPSYKGGAFPQMPYEQITEEEYNNMMSKIKPIDMMKFTYINNSPEEEIDKYCDGESCQLPS